MSLFEDVCVPGLNWLAFEICKVKGEHTSRLGYRGEDSPVRKGCTLEPFSFPSSNFMLRSEFWLKD